MLDGILGRGFSVKCKSLIKTTRTRIEVVRRRPEAKQRFLKEDLAKLLSNGLDINAYGRTEEFIAGMNLLSCYDFVEQSCEHILKQLSRIEKQGECPEECREAVASLMYAAARFSDLPELRDLRDIFQQRYGNCLEAFVNQKFVEKLSSRPPAKEKRLQILQDIASELSIKWDSRGFEQRMATPSVVAQVDDQKTDIVKQRPGLLHEKSQMHSWREGNIWKGDKMDHYSSRKKETTEYREKSYVKSGGSSLQSDGDKMFCGKDGLTENKHLYAIEKGDAKLKTERSNISSHGKIMDNSVHTGDTRHSNGIHNPRKGESTEALFCEKANFAPSCAKHLGKPENAISSYNYSNQDNALNSIKKGADEGSDRLKSCTSYALPPPYIKSNHSISRPPYVNQKEDKHKLSRGSKHAVPDMDEDLINPSSCNRRNVVKSSGRPHNEPDHDDCEEQFVAPAKVKSCGHEEELDYQDGRIPLPKPRSIRRRHPKSSSSHNVEDTLEDVGAENRSSSSRRKDRSRKGLQILFDEEHHRKDDEERMIDRLLIHYSKKPSSYDAGKSRKKMTGQPPLQIISDGESSLDQRQKVHDGKRDVFPPPTRSVSLPHEQAASPEFKKVFARSNTFQPDNQARHVHPKLPDYDDLAARFAALKGR